MRTRAHMLPLGQLLLVLLALSVTAAATTAAPSSSSLSAGQCRPLSSEFDFAKRPPAPSNDLAFCKEYKQSTCCDKSHSLSVLRALAPYFDPSSAVGDSFSDSCRQISSMLMCAPCHPEVGTGARVGVCPALCDQWFGACGEGLFTESEGILRPCTDASLVCAPLREVVRNGAEMCERTGVGLGSLTRQEAPGVHVGFADQVERLVRRGARDQLRLQSGEGKDGQSAAEAPAVDQAEEDEDDAVACFDGSIPSSGGGRTSGDATAAAAAAAAAARDSPKRYYKTAEEVAEIERHRAARQDASRAAELANHPVMQSFRRAALALHELLRPLERSWGRAVRKLTFLPRGLTRALEGHLPFACALLFAQMLLWSFLRALGERCCGNVVRRLRRSAGRPSSSGAGWTAELHPSRSSPFSSLSASGSSLSASGLTAAEIRQQRAEKLMQQQYSAAQRKDDAHDDAQTSVSGRQVTIIDGEIVELPE